jgi:glycerol-3-phosphate cytidylyltransferase
MNRVKVGYATGVFDLFHIGHLNLLRRAKSKCDYLVVGVTSDELVFELKGKRPIIPFAERCEIVQNVRFVDKVVAETTSDKLAAWNDIGFDVTFKGDDWQGSEKWNKLSAELEKRGVEVVFFPYTSHTSSTKLREALDLFSNSHTALARSG